MGEIFFNDEDKNKGGTLSVPKKGEIILGEGYYVPGDDRVTGVNSNICVVGAPGSGKTRGLVIPNILHGRDKSFIVSDPKGQLFREWGDILEKDGRNVQVVDFSNFDGCSVKYNPFAYIRTTQDVTKFAHMLAYQNDSLCTRDPFWDLCAEAAIASMIDYLKFHVSKGVQSLYYLSSMVHLADRRGEEGTSLFDMEIEEIRKKKPDAFCIRKWDKISCSPYKTYSSILATIGAKLARLDTPEIRQLTEENGLDFEKLAEEPTVLFVTIPDTDRSMDCIASLLMAQAYSELIYLADHVYPGGRLPRQTMLILDDYATSLQLPDLDKILAASRSRNISTMVILQNEGQLKEEADVIIGSCDNYIYLGSGDITTAQHVAIKADLDTYTVLQQPIGQSIVFRRGEKPSIHQKCFRLDEHKELYGRQDENIFSMLKGKRKRTGVQCAK